MFFLLHKKYLSTYKSTVHSTVNFKVSLSEHINYIMIDPIIPHPSHKNRTLHFSKVPFFLSNAFLT
jgi:hypothetical protein